MKQEEVEQEEDDQAPPSTPHEKYVYFLRTAKSAFFCCSEKTNIKFLYHRNFFHGTMDLRG